MGKFALLAQLAHLLGKDESSYLDFEDGLFLGIRSENANNVYQSRVELFGDRKIFIIDEVQHDAGW